MASSLEENLTCSICLSVYVDPVVLGCSHSFCRVCLQTEPQRTCPLCRSQITEDPHSNLALRNVCEAFRQSGLDHKPHSVTEDLQQQKDLTENLLKKDQTEKVLQLKKDLTENMLQLEARLKALTRTEGNCCEANRFLTGQARETHKLMKNQLDQLRKFLQQQEKTRLRALMDEEQQKKEGLKDKIEAVRKQKAMVTKTLSDALRLQYKLQNQPQNDSLLHEYWSLVELTQRPLQEEEQRLGMGAVLDEARHMGNLDFQVWSSLMSSVKYYPVLMDSRTASSTDVSLSTDLHSMTVQGASEAPLSGWVLGAEGLSQGVHSWDVDVSRSRCWALGVASRCERLPVVLTELWKMGLSRDVLEAGTLGSRPSPLSEAPGPQRAVQTVRVVLDLDRKDLSFFNLDSELLHSFTLPATEGALFPFFFIGEEGRLQILPRDVQVSTGTPQL